MINNCIGTDITGTRAIGNGLDGVLIADAARANLISENAIVFNGRDGIGLANADRNSIRSNTCNRNGRDGLRADALSTLNFIKKNVMLENGELDGNDDSVGAGSDGTANLWVRNWGVTSDPPGLFED